MIPSGIFRKWFQIFGAIAAIYFYLHSSRRHSVYENINFSPSKEVFTSPNECSNNFTFHYDLNATIDHLRRQPPELPPYVSTPCWSPAGCERWQKILVVIPYRDREASLRISLPILHHILQSQQKSYCILIVEQADYNFFNKALLMNSAFLESSYFGEFNCFIFHDVDMLPENGNLNYQCQDVPLHLSTAVSKFNYRLNYGTQFGGVVALTRHQLLHVNGFSNRFWGWGGEDNEIERRVYQSGLGREGAEPSLGRFTMLTHEHSWSFDPKREIVISTADTVFREIRLKYAYTRDDELGSKPNDWKKDGFNNVNYTITARERRDEFLYLKTDVSMIRATNMSVALNGTNEMALSLDFETDRLGKRPACLFSDEILGHLSGQSRMARLTEPANAKELCQNRPDCFAISKVNESYFLHNETAILHAREYYVSGAGDNVTTTRKGDDKIWLKKCPNRREFLHQFEEPFVLNRSNYSTATLNFTIVANIMPDTDVYLFTTIKPVIEEGVSDFILKQAKKRIIKKTFWNRIERIPQNTFKDGNVTGHTVFRLPVIAGSYEARTVLTDRDARPIGLLRWAWRQVVDEQQVDEHMKTISNVIHRRAPFGDRFQQLDSSWLDFRHLGHNSVY